MSEIEFYQAMDVVGTAIVWVPVGHSPSPVSSPISAEPPKATSDNVRPPRPMIPFAEGWCVC
jgi:hypothetical protein